MTFSNTLNLAGYWSEDGNYNTIGSNIMDVEIILPLPLNKLEKIKNKINMINRCKILYSSIQKKN